MKCEPICYLVPINYQHLAGRPETRLRKPKYIAPAIVANAGETQATYVLLRVKNEVHL